MIIVPTQGLALWLAKSIFYIFLNQVLNGKFISRMRGATNSDSHVNTIMSQVFNWDKTVHMELGQFVS